MCSQRARARKRIVSNTLTCLPDLKPQPAKTGRIETLSICRRSTHGMRVARNPATRGLQHFHECLEEKVVALLGIQPPRATLRWARGMAFASPESAAGVGPCCLGGVVRVWDDVRSDQSGPSDEAHQRALALRHVVLLAIEVLAKQLTKRLTLSAHVTSKPAFSSLLAASAVAASVFLSYLGDTRHAMPCAFLGRRR